MKLNFTTMTMITLRTSSVAIVLGSQMNIRIDEQNEMQKVKLIDKQKQRPTRGRGHRRSFG